VRAGLLVVVAGLAGCLGSAADHERLGDAAYGRQSFEEALAEYRAALKTAPSADLEAKLGQTAIHTNNFRDAAQSYRTLALEDPARVEEAATGLERVARTADHAGDAVGLREAVSALRGVEPDRFVGRYALGLARSGKLPAQEALLILPAAIAAAPDAGAVDSMLAQYGAALQETTACEAAARMYRAANRRTRDPKLRARVSAGLAACAIQLGQEALAVNQPDVAARWFGEGAAVDSTSDTGRRALVGLGDARVAQGDILGAAMAYQAAIGDESTADTIAQMAAHKLNALGSAQPGPDTLKANQ
jgi:tetratricopeptide (TPR) repeat protein